MRSGVALAGVVLALWTAVATSAPAADSHAVVEDLLAASGIKPKLIRAADQGRVALMTAGTSASVATSRTWHGSSSWRKT